MRVILDNIAVLLVLVACVAAWMLLPIQILALVIILFFVWLFFSRVGKQAFLLTSISLGGVRKRLGTSSVIVLGIAGVVAVLVALLAMGNGFSSTLQQSGQTDVAIVLRQGSLSEAQSVISRLSLDTILESSAIAHDAANKPVASAESVVGVNIKDDNGSDDASILLRGVDQPAFMLRPNLKVIEGRTFSTGLHELIVGHGVASQFKELKIGSEVALGSERWKIVGVFASGDAYDSEIWADRKVVSDVWRQGDSVQSVLVKLAAPYSFKSFKEDLSSDPKLLVQVSTSHDFFVQQSQGITQLIRVIGLAIGGIMAAGAIFAALNCMFTAVAARSTEIATLRAVGFQSTPIIISVLLETILFALIGGLIGGGVAWLAFNNYTASTLSGFNQVIFHFKVTPQLICTGLNWALAIGFIGGAFPAFSVARLSVVSALREL